MIKSTCQTTGLVSSIRAKLLAQPDIGLDSTHPLRPLLPPGHGPGSPGELKSDPKSPPEASATAWWTPWAPAWGAPSCGGCGSGSHGADLGRRGRPPFWDRTCRRNLRRLKKEEAKKGPYFGPAAKAIMEVVWGLRQKEGGTSNPDSFRDCWREGKCREPVGFLQKELSCFWPCRFVKMPEPFNLCNSCCCCCCCCLKAWYTPSQRKARSEQECTLLCLHFLYFRHILHTLLQPL